MKTKKVQPQFLKKECPHTNSDSTACGGDIMTGYKNHRTLAKCTKCGRLCHVNAQGHSYLGGE